MLAVRRIGDPLPAPDLQTFSVVAHRVDDGARWLLDVLALPGVSTEVRELRDGAAAARAVIAAQLGRVQDDVKVAIALS